MSSATMMGVRYPAVTLSCWQSSETFINPRKMEDYGTGRSHFVPIIQDAKKVGVSAFVISLGDLGESKSVYPDKTNELFAGTTECHELAHQFLSSFGAPYEVIAGNHDLEGIDEFATDKANLEAFLRIHGKPTPHFMTQVAEKTLIVGLGSTVFRDAKYTSHEVTIDEASGELKAANRQAALPAGQAPGQSAKN
jgi:hypothetical protein